MSFWKKAGIMILALGYYFITLSNPVVPLTFSAKFSDGDKKVDLYTVSAQLGLFADVVSEVKQENRLTRQQQSFEQLGNLFKSQAEAAQLFSMIKENSFKVALIHQRILRWQLYPFHSFW